MVSILPKRNKMKIVNLKSFLSLLFTFIIVIHSTGQITSAGVDQLVEDAMEKFVVAGVAVGIVKDGEIIHARGYGVQSV